MNEGLKESVLKLHILYLENLERLTLKERMAYESYFDYLANPIVTEDSGLSEQELNDFLEEAGIKET